MDARLYGILVTPTDGMGCEWNNPCGRKSVYQLDDNGIGDIIKLNLCTQHAKIVMKRYTGWTVMAEDLEHAVRRERVYKEIELQAFFAGWEAAMESLESEEALY